MPNISSSRLIEAKKVHADCSNRSTLLWGPVLAAVITVLFLAGSPKTSALTIGLMSADQSWEQEEGWDLIRKSGAKIFRAQIRGTDYNDPATRAKIETMFTRAAERDITILPYLYGRPTKSGSQQFLTQGELAEGSNAWENFVKNVVWEFGYNGWFWTNHPNLPYKPVTAWEVWNEPNLPPNNPGGSVVQPEEYARFLKRTSQVIKAAQNNNAPGFGIEVLFGGLYAAGGLSVDKFLERAHSVPETGLHFNGLSLHPYSFQGGAWGVEQYVNGARNKLNELLWSGKSLWITEIGWNIEPWGDSNHLAVFQDQQRDYLNWSFNWIKSVAAAKNIPVIIWYILRDNASDGAWDHHSGLIRSDSTFRPAWYAFQAQTGAPPWPLEWYVDSLGGSISSDPEASSWGYGRLDFFARGTNNHLVHRSYQGGWNEWEDLGGSLTSGAGAASWGANRIDVAARVADGSIGHWASANGTSWAYDNLGEPKATSDPDVSSWGYGRLDFFVRGANNELRHRYYDGAWSAWETIPGGPALASGPAAVSWGPNRIDVVARLADNTLGHWATGNGTSWAYDNLGGTITSDPDISSWGYGRLDFFAQGTNGHLLHRWYQGGFSPWEDLGTSIASGPGAVSWGPNRIDVVGRAVNGTVTHWAGVVP